MRALLLFLVFSFSQSSWAELGPYKVKATAFSGGFYLAQLIYYPENISELGKLALVVISHGNGHDYRSYKYLQKQLASHGYIVMTHRNNTGPGIETASLSTLYNTDFFLESLEEIGGGVLLDKVDVQRIAWIGHSRGAEGVVRAYDRIVDDEYKPKKFQRESIKFISSIAPTTFLSAKKADPHEMNYHMFVGGADGDVNGGPGRVVMSMPIYERAKGEKMLTYVQGAGHNVFNDDSWDEGQGKNRLKRAEVHTIAKEVYTALLDVYLRGNRSWMEYFTQNWSTHRLPEVPMEFRISNEYKLAVDSEKRLSIDDFQEEDSALDMASSGAVVDYDVTGLYEGILQDRDRTFVYKTLRPDPMNGMTRYLDQEEPPKGLAFDWYGSKFKISYTLTSEQENFSDFEALSLRAAQGSRHPLTMLLKGDLSFSVRLTDVNGRVSLLETGLYGMINAPYDRESGWANEFNILRIPLIDFQEAEQSLDMKKIKKLEFLFGSYYGSDKGRLFLDDIELVK